MRNVKKVLVELVVDTDNAAEATDGIGEMLRANEQRLNPEADRLQAFVVDWRFVGEPESLEVGGRAVYVEGEAFAELA